jgi:hypothetical protein
MRVDLAGIEAVLHDHPGVKQAVVVGRARKDNHMELVAYIVATGHRTTGRSEIYQFLAAKLSPDQIPTRFVFLESFPLTHTHKVDRKALPDPDEIETTKDPEWIAPRNDVEALLHGIWAEILGHQSFGVTEPFLQAGGDSLGGHAPSQSPCSGIGGVDPVARPLDGGDYRIARRPGPASRH